MRVGAIDLGTNSTRLLVAEIDDEYRQIVRRMAITRLGAGVDATGRLNQDAIERTITVLTELSPLVDGSAVRIAATSACRDATNRDEFFDRVESVLGVRPELLSGRDEARLGFMGATAQMRGGPFLVSDIGGGSTELVVGEASGAAVVPDVEIAGSTSLNIGCVRVTERFLKDDPPRPDQLDEAGAEVDAQLADAGSRLDIGSARSLIGVAGTITTLAGLHLGLDRYEPEKTHHSRLPADAVERLFRELSTLTISERREIPGIESGRADVILGGIIILLAILRNWGFGEVIVSESDILDGLALSLGPISPGPISPGPRGSA